MQLRLTSTVVFAPAFLLCLAASEPDSVTETNASGESNATLPRSKEDTIAEMLDRALEKEFNETEQSEACGGIAFACAGQPVETVAQFGVMFLLFALGLEFSTTKLCVVQVVAVVGDLLQIFLFTCLSGITAWLCGGSPSGGVFVGAFLSMSSTAVVTPL